MSTLAVPTIGFAAWSGTGKTTLLERLLPLLKAEGLRIGVIKHAHHDFDIDHPGKDSWRLRKAGADQMLIGSDRRWALLVEHPFEHDPTLNEMLAHLVPGELDLILVEGFKREPYPKIELHRPSLSRPLMATDDPTIVAIATDAPIVPPRAIPLLDLNAPESIARWLLTELLGRRQVAGAPQSTGKEGAP